MSKQANKALENAEAMLRRAGITDTNLIESIADGLARTAGGKKLWRNSCRLACLIIDSAANALQTEDAASMRENGFDDIREAVLAYIASNLDDWSQAEWTQCCVTDLKAALARLDEMVNGFIAREAEASAQSPVAGDTEARRAGSAEYFDALPEGEIAMNYNEWRGCLLPVAAQDGRTE